MGAFMMVWGKDGIYTTFSLRCFPDPSFAEMYPFDLHLTLVGLGNEHTKLFVPPRDFTQIKQKRMI